MPKSFDMVFDTNGEVVIKNIKGVDGTACLNLTRPYVRELEDVKNPAETIMDEIATTLFSEDSISDTI
jgi:hypothetical protein